jgi:hypothetical protein
MDLRRTHSDGKTGNEQQSPGVLGQLVDEMAQGRLLIAGHQEDSRQVASGTEMVTWVTGALVNFSIRNKTGDDRSIFLIILL